jgi:2,5-dioxopentanoate dehydrogenase
MKKVSDQELENIFEQAQQAFWVMSKAGIPKRVELMRNIANEVEALGPELIETAQAESRLPEGRLAGEKARTVFQWRSYADALERGAPLDPSIDTANADRTPPKPDIRKTGAGLGPVTVFGASNFPFAFSTAGGDTASAIAAGCPVIVKAHSGHPKTSYLMAEAVSRGVEKSGFPEGTFSHVFCQNHEQAQLLVSHPVIKAVGFTGSNWAGMTLVDVANRRPEPIPVFAEMGSINPVFLLPEKLKAGAAELAKQYVGSLTLGVGQFCTNPGLAIGVQGEDFDVFTEALKEEIGKTAPAPMLNPNIAKGYSANRQKLVSQENVEVLAVATEEDLEGCGTPTVAVALGVDFLINDALQDEVFGPFALVVKCRDHAELLAVTDKLHGQLTATLLGTEQDLTENTELLAAIQNKCGRIIFNNFPTGVEVCKSMHHGGPFPSSSNSQFTSVGSDSIKRFLRPVSFQNWPDALLPDELKNANPLGMFRTVDNVLTKESV